MKRIVSLLFAAWLGTVVGMAYTSHRVASTCDIPGAGLTINGDHFICAPMRAIQEAPTSVPGDVARTPRMVA
ncbi:hypothetical protein [Burkholderia ubonensis]|uniref:hypothetical protein n=1 Tax=Burkholderia ubonensis TaxID=101571 RepID=UPI00075F1BA7|nr:hypothetical protein [Burkholderia ubonensis]